MSIFRSFEKRAGVLRVRASEPAPRWVDITNMDTGSAVTGLELEQVRDLHYMLGRILALAEEDDAKAQR